MRCRCKRVSILTSTNERKERASPVEFRISLATRFSIVPSAMDIASTMDSPLILSRTIPDIPDIATSRYSWRRAGACNRRLALWSLLQCFLPAHTDSSDTWKVSKRMFVKDRGWTRGKTYARARHMNQLNFSTLHLEIINVACIQLL